MIVTLSPEYVNCQKCLVSIACLDSFTKYFINNSTTNYFALFGMHLLDVVLSFRYI